MFKTVYDFIEAISFWMIIIAIPAVTVGFWLITDVIVQWEIANDYPFGKLCDLYNSCQRGK